jgi:hypothetical protein
MPRSSKAIPENERSAFVERVVLELYDYHYASAYDDAPPLDTLADVDAAMRINVNHFATDPGGFWDDLQERFGLSEELCAPIPFMTLEKIIAHLRRVWDGTDHEPELSNRAAGHAHLHQLLAARKV